MTTATGTKSGQPTHTWDYQYDALNRLSAVRYDAVLIARYGYDVLGRRIAKRVYDAGTGGTVGYLRFVYRGSQVSFEADSAGTVGTRYVWGVGTDNLVALRTGTTTRYVVVDKLGSVRGLVDRDGTWYSSVRYTPYGAIARTNGPAPIHRYRWTGREYDAETGLYFHRARYYSPDMRRFTQEDPIGYAGASNLYAYVDGDVLEARDPSGLLKSTVDGPRGFRPECTLGGSQLNWDGSVGTCSATHVGADGGGGGGLLAWAKRLTDEKGVIFCGVGGITGNAGGCAIYLNLKRIVDEINSQITTEALAVAEVLGTSVWRDYTGAANKTPWVGTYHRGPWIFLDSPQMDSRGYVFYEIGLAHEIGHRAAESLARISIFQRDQHAVDVEDVIRSYYGCQPRYTHRRIPACMSD